MKKIYLLLLLTITSCFNNPPTSVISIKPDSGYTVGTEIKLSSWQSIIGMPLALNRVWTIQQAPAGSTAEITDTKASSSTFTPDLQGKYIISLVTYHQYTQYESEGQKSTREIYSEPTSIAFTVTQADGIFAEILEFSFLKEPNGSNLTQDIRGYITVEDAQKVIIINTELSLISGKALTPSYTTSHDDLEIKNSNNDRNIDEGIFIPINPENFSVTLHLYNGSTKLDEYILRFTSN
ncbi:MAG: hypothetical protein JXR63_03460 [Spirochaetales bacterium]|nr:hypothetical protein [Spirochaetales bacterium]